MGRTFAIAIAFLCFFFLSVTANAFEIRVRGKAFVEAKVNHASTMLQVSGVLRDDLDRGLRERPLKITITQDNLEISSATIRTKSQGAFFYREEFAPGDYTVRVAFLGDQLLDGDVQQWTTTLETAPVQLQIMAPEFLYNPEKAILHASAKSASIPLIGTLRVFVNGTSAADLVLDAAGRGGLDLLKYLQPGKNTIDVSLPGSAFREEITQRREIRYATKLTVSGEANERLERLRRGLGVRGKVVDSIGGVENLPVTVVISKVGVGLKEEQKLRARTDSAGNFSTFFFADKMTDGDWDILITVSPRGQSLTKTIPSFNWNTKTERFVLNAFALIAILGALILLFSVFKIRILNRKNKRREKLDKKRKRELAFVKGDTIVPTVLSSGTPKDINRKVIGGVVVDAWKNQTLTPVFNAKIDVRSREGAFEFMTDETGRFELTLPVGDYELEVSKFGFVRGKHAFSIPHTGILSNFKIDLVPVPLKIRRLFEAISEEKGGRAFWGYKTPQEIEKVLKLAWPGMDTVEDGIERKKLREALRPIIESNDDKGIASQELLAALSSIVEESYFSGELYSEETWFFMRNIAIRLVENQ